MKAYVLAHWRGEQSLARSVLINGLLGYLVVVLILVGLNQFAVGLALLVAWFCWAFVGIARSAIRIFRSPASTLLAKSFSAAAVALVLMVAFLTVRDLVVLLR